MLNNPWTCGEPTIGPELEQLRYILAKAYVPYQIYNMKYPLDQALKMGTVFPELVKPWPPYYYEEVVKK